MSNTETAVVVKREKTGGRKLGTLNRKTLELKEMGIE